MYFIYGTAKEQKTQNWNFTKTARAQSLVVFTGFSSFLFGTVAGLELLNMRENECKFFRG